VTPVEPRLRAKRRPARLALPNGKRVAVFIVINVENWDIGEPCRASADGAAGRLGHSRPAELAWHEYGMRVGSGV